MFLESAEYWHWWVFGIVLIILELFAPGAFFMWLGIAAGVVGFIMLVMPDMTWQTQWILFAVLSVVSIIAWRMFAKKQPPETDHPTLNRRGEQYVGRTFTLSEPITDGVGKIRVDDSMWKIEGLDCPAGTKIKVISADGTMLKVEVDGHQQD